MIMKPGTLATVNIVYGSYTQVWSVFLQREIVAMMSGLKKHSGHVVKKKKQLKKTVQLHVSVHISSHNFCKPSLKKQNKKNTTTTKSKT